MLSTPTTIEAAGVRRLVVFTDLDGSLIDERTYSFEPAAAALQALARAGVQVIPVTSKTRAELEVLAGELDIRGPWIVENGGAVVVPRDRAETVPAGAFEEAGDYLVLPLGVAREQLVAALREMESEVGTVLVGFSNMDRESITELTGLSGAAADRAMAREYDEPFLPIEGGALERLSCIAAERGLIVTRGGRFFHLTGGVDKGQAVRRLLALLRGGSRLASVGLGDSPNDLSMLLAVDRPIVVPRPGGRADRFLAERLPRAELAPHPGPRGWQEAVLGVLGGRVLPFVETEERRR
ncbi:MAG: HAD-IIB family hydrolase [Vicinamibacterales bacterium]